MKDVEIRIVTSRRSRSWRRLDFLLSFLNFKCSERIITFKIIILPVSVLLLFTTSARTFYFVDRPCQKPRAAWQIEQDRHQINIHRFDKTVYYTHYHTFQE